MFWLIVAVIATSVSRDANAASDAVREQLRTRLEVAGLPVELSVKEEPILAHAALPYFYAKRSFEPAWADDAGPKPLAAQLLDRIRAAEREGLRPDDYHAGSIAELVAEARGADTVDLGRLVDLELMLTDAFLLYASHLMGGRVDPTSFDAEWHVPVSRRADVVSALEDALQRRDVGAALDELEPRQGGYRRLVRALLRYREMATRGGWQEVPTGGKLELGVEDDRVRSLRARLLVSGDLRRSDVGNGGTTFDERLREAVVGFQRRHGLVADGVVGAATFEALNVPVEMRTRQIELSLERWRWLPDDLGQRHILVNIPSFELDVVEGSETVMEMRVVVGKPYRRTPVFSAEMTYLVLSPYWHVPPTIAVQDILPELKKDPGYLTKKNMTVFAGWGADAKLLDPRAIDWANVTRSSFPYRFRQDPGPLNALGAVKFMFPNQYSVYLHDTPARELFARPDRSFSSGCIRVENPIELAEYLLAGDARWTRETILGAVESGVEQTVRLPAPLAVHLQYWTSWVDRKDAVHFRKDIYERDRLLANALERSRLQRYPSREVRNTAEPAPKY